MLERKYKFIFVDATVEIKISVNKESHPDYFDKLLDDMLKGVDALSNSTHQGGPLNGAIATEVISE